MDKLVKYISENRVQRAPRVIFDGDNYIANPTSEMLKAQGFKTLVVDPEPEIGENEYLVPRYTQTAKRVTQHWVVMQMEEPTMEDGGDE